MEVLLPLTEAPLSESISFLKGSRYGPDIRQALNRLAEDGSMGPLEQAMERVIFEFIRDARLIPPGVEPVVGYLAAKQNEAEIQQKGTKEEIAAARADAQRASQASYLAQERLKARQSEQRYLGEDKRLQQKMGKLPEELKEDVDALMAARKAAADAWGRVAAAIIPGSLPGLMLVLRLRTLRGGGALLNATPRPFLTLNLLGPPGHRAMFLRAWEPTHALLSSCGFLAPKASEDTPSSRPSRIAKIE